LFQIIYLLTMGIPRDTSLKVLRLTDERALSLYTLNEAKGFPGLLKEKRFVPLYSIGRIIADLQWRDQAPAAREAESRQAYIERRLAEMSHARDAYTAWVLFEKGEDGMNWLRHLYEINDRARDLYRIDGHHSWRDSYLPRTPQEPFGYERVKEHNLGVFERRFTANRWDFCRPSWDACSPTLPNDTHFERSNDELWAA
jgi:hypothetical protein